LEDLGGQVRDAAYGIIAGKGHTNLAIGLASTRIARATSREEHAVLPVTVRIDVESVGEVCLSVPASSDAAESSRRCPSSSMTTSAGASCTALPS
jgi:L-lactate dehydrogenase